VDNTLLGMGTGVGYTLPANANFLLKPITATTIMPAGVAPPLTNGVVTALPKGGVLGITF
jgi:hypothetical protein